MGAYATTLLPIAGGYLIAHYLTLLIQGAVWIPTLVADPLSTVAPPLDWIPISGVWYLSVAAIVIGHVAAVVLAHRRALRDSARRPILAGLPLVVLMIGYTVLSLWIIAQPITIEPGSTPAAPRPLMDVSLALAFAAGLLSFVSPCVLALVPVYLAFLGETAALAGPGQTTLTRAVRCSASALPSSPASRSCSCCSGPRWDFGSVLFRIDGARQVAGIAVIAIGLLTTGIFGPVLDRLGGVGVRADLLPAARSARALSLGALVAIGWTPCIGRVLGAILTLGFSSAQCLGRRAAAPRLLGRPRRPVPARRAGAAPPPAAAGCTAAPPSGRPGRLWPLHHGDWRADPDQRLHPDGRALHHHLTR